MRELFEPLVSAGAVRSIRLQFCSMDHKNGISDEIGLVELKEHCAEAKMDLQL